MNDKDNTLLIVKVVIAVAMIAITMSMIPDMQGHPSSKSVHVFVKGILVSLAFLMLVVVDLQSRVRPKQRPEKKPRKYWPKRRTIGKRE